MSTMSHYKLTVRKTHQQENEEEHEGVQAAMTLSDRCSA